MIHPKYLRAILFATLFTILLMILCAMRTQATTITISSFTITDWNYGGSTATLRVTLNSQFVDSDGATWNPGPAFTKIVTCTVASRVVTCPSFTRASTTDAQVNRLALYTGKLYDAGGSLRATVFENYQLPVSMGVTISLAQWHVYNNGLQLQNPPATYLSQDQVQAAIQDAFEAGNAASTTSLGRVKISTTPVDAASPVALGSNDPLVSQLCLAAQGCFDANDTAYGAVAYQTSSPSSVCASGTDSAAAITSAIDAATTWAQANNGKATVRLSPGTYCIKRAPQTTNSAYAQIPLPKLAMATNKVHLTLEVKGPGGHAIPFQTPGAGASALFYSTLTGQSYSGVNGHPCILGGPDPIHGTTYLFWSWMHFHLRGISFRTAQNPSVCGVNLQNLNDATIEDSRADVDSPSGLPADFGEPTNPTGIAYLMPLTDTDGGDYRGKIQVAGWYGGVGVSELTDAGGVIFTYRCKVGLVVQASWFFAPHIKHAIVSRSPYVIAAINPATGIIPVGDEHVTFGTTWRTHLKIDLLAVEDEQSLAWAMPVAYVYDPASKLAGDITFMRSVPNSGQDFGLPQASQYARNLRFTDLLRPRYQPDLVYDALAGPAGKALSAFYPQTHQGAKWAAAGGFSDFTFNSGAAKGAGGVTSADVVESGLSDGTISFNAKPSATTGTVGTIFRYTDTNNYWFIEWVLSTGVATVYEKTAGVVTARTNSTIAVTAGKPFTFAVVLSGTSIKGYIGGTQIGSTVTSASHQTSTKHGLYDFDGNAFYGEFRVTQ
jgi:hypothetical protein